MNFAQALSITAATVVIIAGHAVAGGGPLNLTQANPDVHSGRIQTNYDFGTKLFTATGKTLNGTDASNNAMGSLGMRTFSISMYIDSGGILISDVTHPASLTVRGDFGGTDQLLFQSTSILDFGSGVLNKFEFKFKQESGSLAPVGTEIGTILVDTTLSFAGGVPAYSPTGFAGTGFGTADTFVLAVPLPSAVWMGAAGLGSMVVLRKGRRRALKHG